MCFAASLLVPRENDPGNWTIVILSNLAMLQGAVPEFICSHVSSSLLPPSWSISLEWQFYLIAPFFISAIAMGKWWVLPVTLLGVWSAAVWNTSVFVYPSFLPIKLHFFLIGISCYFARKRISCGTFVLSAPYAFIATALIFAVTQKISLAIWTMVFATMIPGDIATGIRSLQHTTLGKILSWVGGISYPIYLCHWPLLMFLNQQLDLKDLLQSENRLLALITAGVSVAAISVLIATVMHHLIEKPGIRLGKRLAQGRHQPIHG